MKKSVLSIIITIVMVVVGLVPSLTGSDYSYAAKKAKAPSTSGKSVVLMDMGSGKVIYEKNANKVREPASVTKILNCLVVLENLDMDTTVTVGDNPETAGSVVGLQSGEKVSAIDLVYGMMLASGNDAAEELAKATAGDVKTFCKMMNQRAKEAGCKRTNYKNSNGLNEDSDNLNKTTAMDLALMTKEAMKNKTFKEVVGTTKYTMAKTNKSDERYLRNSNHCLWDDETMILLDGNYMPLKYEGCTGVKTGYTSTAGMCYVGTATRGNTELLVVTMGADMDPCRFEDAVKLWEYGFNNFKTYTAVKAGTTVFEEKVKHGAYKKVEIGPKEDFDVTVAKKYKAKGNVTTEVITDEKKVEAPVEKGQKVGIINAYDENEKLLGTTDLYALESIEKGGPLSYIGIADEDAPLFILIVVLIIALILAFLIIRAKIRAERERRRRRRRRQRKMRQQQYHDDIRY